MIKGIIILFKIVNGKEYTEEEEKLAQRTLVILLIINIISLLWAWL